MKGTISTFIMMTMVMLLVSCKGTEKIVERPVYIHDTLQATTIRHDSVFLERYTTQYVKGDTVYRDVVTNRYTELTICDTVFQYKEVPVTVKETEVVEVEKELNWFQKTLIGAGAIALLALLGFIIIKVRKAIW